MKKNASILFLVGAVIVVGAIGYAVTHKTTPTNDEEMRESPTIEKSEGSTMTDKQMMDSAKKDGTYVAPKADTTSEQTKPDVTIAISGKNFSFSQEVIRVKEGQRVKVVFTSENGFHDWVVDAFNARTGQVKTGETSTVTFVADHKGTFEYYCSVGAHRANGMIGQLIVE